jgi:hypothetical protein
MSSHRRIGESMPELHRTLATSSALLTLTGVKGQLRQIRYACADRVQRQKWIPDTAYRSVIVICHACQKQIAAGQFRQAAYHLYGAIGALKYQHLEEQEHRLISQLYQVIDSLTILYSAAHRGARHCTL